MIASLWYYVEIKVKHIIMRNKLCILSSLTVLVSSCGLAKYATYDIYNISDNAEVVSESMTVCSDDFDITYVLDDLGIKVTNKTDKTMLIDLGESYCIKGGNEAERLFSNTVTTYSSSTSRGGALNLGAVAGAFGIHGIIGALASGVTVGGTGTEGSSIQIISERYVSIPPYSYRNIRGKGYDKCGAYNDDWKLLTVNADYKLNRQNSPRQTQYIISYAFDGDEKFSSHRDLIYVKEIYSKYPGYKKDRKQVVVTVYNKDNMVDLSVRPVDRSVGGFFIWYVLGVFTAGIIDIPLIWL